jgi:hypothetical protein
MAVNTGLPVWRCRASSWWRSVRISMSLSRSLSHVGYGPAVRQLLHDQHQPG